MRKADAQRGEVVAQEVLQQVRLAVVHARLAAPLDARIDPARESETARRMKAKLTQKTGNSSRAQILQ